MVPETTPLKFMGLCGTGLWDTGSLGRRERSREAGCPAPGLSGCYSTLYQTLLQLEALFLKRNKEHLHSCFMFALAPFQVPFRNVFAGVPGWHSH